MHLFDIFFSFFILEQISELPYGKWTSNYKDHLMYMCGKGDIKSFTEHHTTESVLFKIIAAKVIY